MLFFFLLGKYDLANFLGMLYCGLGGQLWLFVIVGIIIIYLIFKFVSATVEEYIAPGNQQPILNLSLFTFF